LTDWKQISVGDRFFDTDFLIYLLSADAAKADVSIPRQSRGL
jgi:hypothetical protein